MQFHFRAVFRHIACSLPLMVLAACSSGDESGQRGAPSVGFVVALTVFCFARVLRTPAPGEHMHAPLDIDTHDTEP